MKKTRIRVLSILLAVMMIIAMMPMTVLAEGSDSYIQNIGAQEEKIDVYATLKASIEAAPTDGTLTTVSLAGNITDMTAQQIITIKNGQNIMLDMNGYCITVAPDFTGRPIKNNGTLTITGNGKIDSSASDLGGYGAIDNYGTLTIQNGTFTGSVNASGSSIKNRAGGILTINGGTFNGAPTAVYNEGIAKIYNGHFECHSCSSCNHNSWGYTIQSHRNDGGESPQLYFYDGTVIGVQGAFSSSAGYTEIHDGQFETVSCSTHTNGNSAYYALYVAGEDEDVKCVVYDGTFKSVSKTAALIGNDNTNGDGGINANATSEIKGGTFIAPEGIAAITGAENTGNPLITGGIFSSDPSKYVVAGYEAVSENGSWNVSKKAPVKVDSEEKLLNAVTNAQPGDTIELTEDIHVNGGSVTNGSAVEIKTDNITLDGNDHKIIADNFPLVPDKNYGQHILGITGADNVTIQDLTIVGVNEDENKSNNCLNVYESESVILNNVTVKGTPAAGLLVNGSTVTATDFNASDNGWYDVGVANGSGVTAEPHFKLVSGSLGSEYQISASDIDSVEVPEGWITVDLGEGRGYLFASSIPKSGVEAIVGNVAYTSLKSAVDEAQSGDTITILAKEIELTQALDIDKDLIIEGNGATITADKCVGFYIKNNLNNLTVRNLTLKGVEDEDGIAGEGGSGSFMGIGTYDGGYGVGKLTLSDVTIDGFSYGLYFGAKTDNTAQVSVDADNMTIQNCYIKGAYFEKLTDSDFNQCSFLNNGKDAAKVEDNFKNWVCGVDVNLKYDDYQNIVFDGCTFTGNGDNNGTALHIKARGTGSDSSYNADPASLQNVTITGCTFEGNNGDASVVFGEPGKENTSPVNISVQKDVTFTNNLAGVAVVTFDSNGGSDVPTQIIEKDSALSNLPTPTRSGYSFLGWYTETSGGEKVTAETIFEADTVVYAQWSRNSSSGGGSSSGNKTGRLPIRMVPLRLL